MIRTLGLLFAVCAAFAAPADPAGAIVFDADLTKGLGGLPTTARVEGGDWDDGWVVTDNGQVIVLDAGYPVRNGALEVTYTFKNPADSAGAYLKPPVHRYTMPIGLFELPALGKTGPEPGDMIRIWMGPGERIRNHQAVLRAAVKETKEFRWNEEIGRWADHNTDGKTAVTVRLEWRDGKASYRDVTGKMWPCPKDCMGQMNALRYATLGSDKAIEGSGVGMRFLRARMIDFDKQQNENAQTARKRTVFDVDLTRGPDALPGRSAIIGGEWDGGWRVTNNRQRIVLDPGYTIKNGTLEVTMTRKRVPQTGDKMNAFGIYEQPNIDQADIHGDIFYVRIGKTEIGQGVQGNVKAFTKTELKPGMDTSHASMKWEERFGKFADWVMDDKSPVTIKLEWKNGTGTITEIRGASLPCPQNCGGELDALRYVVLGGDRYDGGASLIGLRFLKVKLTDLDAPES